MRLIDADALSAFVGDLRNTLHKEQSTFKAMTEIEFNARDYMLLNFQYAIDNAPTVDVKPFANVTFDKDELEQIVRDRVIEPIENGELVIKTEERPQGEWVVDEEHSITMTFYKCTNCNYFGGATHYRYCPHCGADMRKDAENDSSLS